MHHSGPPMTLGNMRANGVRKLSVYCAASDCGHHSVVDVDGYGDDVPVPWFGPRLRCERCGHKGADARPNRGERVTLGRVGYNDSVKAGANPGSILK